MCYDMRFSACLLRHSVNVFTDYIGCFITVTNVET